MEELAMRTFKNELQGMLSNNSFDQMLELYEEFSNLETEVEKGICGEWMDNIEAFYKLGETKYTNHKVLINSESFLKKVLYVVDEEEYNGCLGDKKLCMFKTMEKLGLFKNLPQDVRDKVDRYNPELLTTPINRSVVKTYQLRNMAAHTSDECSITEMLSNVNAVMLTTMYAVWQNREKIQAKVSKAVGDAQFGIASLLKETVKSYKEQERKGFTYVSLLWESENSDEVSPQHKRMQISELLEDKRILLSGEAGCGKTTSLEYLEYQAAQSYLSGESAIVPVNIALINESADSTLEDIICSKLNISLSYCENLLQKGLLYLFIDGLNELTADMDRKKSFIVSIEQFFIRYPKVFAVVTDRKYSLFPVRVDKVYHLKRMEKADIINYAKTKAECNEKTLKLLEEVLNDTAFAHLEYTPLLVNQLLIALSMEGKVPSDSSELIGVYLEALMKREFIDKRDVNAAPGKLDIILMKLACEDCKEEGINYFRALKICSSAIQEYGIGITSDAGIELAVQMGILKKSGNYIDFVLDAYRSYYFMKAMDCDI